MEIPPASLALEKLGIPHQIFRHENPVTSFEQAAKERGQRAAQIVRSILFRLTGEEFVMVLIAGSAQVSWKILRRYLGSSRMTMATEEEVLAVTGYRIGAVSPLGLPNPLRVLVDESVLREEEISIGSGIRNTAIILKSADLQQALKNIEILSLVET
ncbi:Cys-tRNA(Pro)/Cys-tRNA(Cys) deacylase YbaK [Anaerolineales bacterium]|nr:Cys-tRNA(Pro)/Cys-tRNA(Cys) deacylase YbaK [Anaerolineales bacterium]